MPTQDEFYSALHGELPTGLVWPGSADEAVVNTLIENFAFAAKEVDDDATTEFDDVFPDVTTNYLDDWERVLGLPKSYTTIVLFTCDVNVADDPLGVTTVATPTPTTDDERRNLILSLLNNDPLNNAAFYETLAGVFGLTVTVTTGVTPLEWSILVTGGPPAKVDIYTAMVNFYKPAHTQVTVT